MGGRGWGTGVSLTGVAATVAGQARITCVTAGEIEVRYDGVPAGNEVVGGPDALLGPAGAVGDADIGALNGIDFGCHILGFVNDRYKDWLDVACQVLVIWMRDRVDLLVRKEEGVPNALQSRRSKRPSGGSAHLTDAPGHLFTCHLNCLLGIACSELCF